MEEDMKVMMVLEGRKFIPVEDTTFEQDLWIMAHVRNAHLIDIRLTEVTAMTDLAEDVLMRAYTSGKLFLILAGILTEEDKVWSPDEAVKNATFFSQLKDQESKTNLQAAVVGVLARFFLSAAASLGISTSSSRSLAATSPSPDHPVALEISESGIP